MRVSVKGYVRLRAVFIESKIMLHHEAWVPS